MRERPVTADATGRLARVRAVSAAQRYRMRTPSTDREIIIAGTTEQVLAALDRSDAELAHIGAAARRRVLSRHTAERRAAELETLLSQFGE